jgi:hypothetical protein
MSAAVAAIEYALKTEDGIDFLRHWNEGSFDICRKHWDDAPEACYIGADPLLPQTKDLLAQNERKGDYARRWHIFRNRDAFAGIDFDVFRDQFREDADAIVDTAKQLPGTLI